MLEYRLGSVELADGSHAVNMLGESARSIAGGRFDVVGRIDPASRRFRSGALVRSLGNDQWFVHLINVEQLARLAQSELLNVQTGDGLSNAQVESLATHVSLGIAAHLALGPAGTVAAPIVELASAALESLVSEYSPQAKRIAQDLADSGVRPENKGEVRRAVARIADASPNTPVPGASSDALQRPSATFLMQSEVAIPATTTLTPAAEEPGRVSEMSVEPSKPGADSRARLEAGDNRMAPARAKTPFALEIER